MHLMRLEIGNNLGQLRNQILDEGPRFGGLLRDKLPFTFLGNFEKCITSHVLHARVQFVHELKQLVDYRLQELPMRPQKAGILPDDVHYIGRDASLVSLATFHFT